MTKKQKKMTWRIITTFSSLVILHFIPFESKIASLVKLALYFAAYLLISGDILRKAGRGILNRQVFDENFLMAIASLGAFALALYTKSGDYVEAVAVMLFYQVGELFENIAVGKSRKNISNLMDIRPDYANIEKNGKLEKVSPDHVALGSIIIVQPGEKIPLDGIVTEGNSSLNTTALTGESLPRDVSKDDEVISGCINLTGVLKIRTTKEFSESTVSKILELVENSTSRKSKSEAFISKFARVYTPLVCYSALAIAILPPVIRVFLLGTAPLWQTWLYRALTFLVISCPCALVISIPLTFFAGIGGASRNGILVKGSNYLETLSKVKTVVFDKTGTLTHGTFEVSGIHHSKIEDEKLLEYAALAECASSHPISKSLQNAHNKELDRKRVKDIQELSGMGIIASVDGKSVAAGNKKLMEHLNIGYKECHKSGTIIHLAIDSEYAGHIVISDKIKKNSKEAISQLKKAGVSKTVMLTGDEKRTAESVAEEIGIDNVYSELLPSDKVSKIEEIIEEQKALKNGGYTAFCGDGINDAPVISRSDVGIAMGAIGSDAAIEAADIVIMDDDPLKIAKAIKISKHSLRIVRQNITFSIGVKSACLLLGALGIANMWIAIFADVGVMILAVLNAIRALKVS